MEPSFDDGCRRMAADGVIVSSGLHPGAGRPSRRRQDRVALRTAAAALTLPGKAHRVLAIHLQGLPVSLSFYQASVPVFLRGFDNLSGLLDKAAAHVALSGTAEAALVEARLAPDMYPLARQVQIASDAAKGCVARLAGLDVPSFPDDETTIDELKVRIAKTVEFIKSVDSAAVNAGADRVIEIKLGGVPTPFTAQAYLLGFAMPNFYFHLTTAYAIMRHNGVPLGKMDYLGKP
jgi:hypothetical protein